MAARPRICHFVADVLERFYLPLLSIHSPSAHVSPMQTRHPSRSRRLSHTRHPWQSIAEREAVAEQDQVAKEYRSAAIAVPSLFIR